MSGTLVAVGLLVACLAAAAQAATGFGFALVAVPLLTPIAGAAVTVPAVTTLSAVLVLGSTVSVRRDVQWRSAGLLTGASAVGMPLGLLALTLLSPRLLAGLVAVVLLGLLVLLRRGLTLRQRPRSYAVAGFAGGALLTSVGMNGPPMVAALHAMQLPPRPMRATLQTAICAQDCVAVLAFALTGQLTATSLLLTLVGIPGAAAGWLLGDRLFRRLDARRFRRAVLLVLLLSAALSLTRSITG